MNRAVVFVKSMLAGGAATLVDVGVFFLLNSVVGIDARWANVPAMIAGGVANFVGNRRFAFHAHHGNLTRQAQRFCAVTLIAWVLQAGAFHFTVDEVAAIIPPGALRLIVGNLVYLCWSYPMYRRIFHVHAATHRASVGDAASALVSSR